MANTEIIPVIDLGPYLAGGSYAYRAFGSKVGSRSILICGPDARMA
jgi:hypothetical protein